MDSRIAFNRPYFAGKELQYISDAIRQGHASGDGSFSQKCHEFLERTLRVRKALLTTSCTHALEMAAILLEIKPGDEVIVPSFTFVSTANAFALRGAKPLFIDIREDTLNMDEKLVETVVTRKTKAIVPVHYAGVGCEMDFIMEFSRVRKIPVVEDNAHGLFARYQNRYLGTFGSLATQSFHETKNLICGEGGALLLNDERLIERAEIIREKGTNRKRFFRGQVDKYSWVDIGSSYLPSDILAAFLFAQLECWENIQEKRRRIWERYDAELKSWAEREGVRTPHTPSHCEQSYHMYYLLAPSLSFRQRLIASLASHGILSVFHYQPLHLSDMGKKFGGFLGQCPVTESVADRLLRLPFYNAFSPEDQGRVIEQVSSFSSRHAKAA